MRVLFSPSEAKSDFIDSKNISIKSSIFSSLFTKRLEVIEKLKKFLAKSSSQDIKNFFGVKNGYDNLAKLDLLSSSTCKAVQRYTGVAYKHLDFNTLSDKQKNWICENTLIFSNLFGPIRAGDYIPYYRFKQGSTIDGFKTEIFYKKNFSDAIDNYIGKDLVIDLRANFYEKFYSLKCKHIGMKFIKNKKVVSHWAKAYRGKVLRDLAKHQPQSIKEFENINFSDLSIVEIIEKKLKREYIFKIS